MVKLMAGSFRQVLWAVCAAAVLLAEGAPRELARFGLDEGFGSVSDDAVAGQVATLGRETKWAKGAFGCAVATGPRDSAVDLGEIAGLDGAEEATVFLRFRRDGNGTGAYPSLLSADGWGSRGGILFFSTGDNLTVRLRGGTPAKECSWTAFNKMPKRKWCSVALVFRRPSVTVYANGKAVATGRWDLPLTTGRLRLGGWSGSVFGGFLDDFRALASALPADAVAELANDPRYEEAEGYQDDGTGGIQKTEIVGQAAPTAFSLANDIVALSFDACGAVSSLKEKSTGRELVASAVPFAEVKAKDGRTLLPRKAERLPSGDVRLSFARGAGEIDFGVAPFAGGWVFTVKSYRGPAPSALRFGRIRPAADTFVGDFVNAWSDERSAVAVRSTDIFAKPFANPVLGVEVEPGVDAVGRGAALAAGPRAGFRDQLKAMTKAVGAPQSDCGGAWSMDSDVARWSYVFSPVRKGDIDYWISFVKRGGFSTIHLNSNWTDMLGEYTVNPAAFPGGLDEMAAAAEKVRAAGLHCGIHSLTACISLRSKWLHPVCDSNLVFDATYTLSEPLKAGDDELRVNERPIARHSTVCTYSSNGNILFLDGELMQYAGIRREKPYAFTGLKRGAFGTRRVARDVPAGTTVRYAHQRYMALYPDPDGPLAKKVADQLNRVYNTCKLDEFYFDGSEGMGTRYGVDAMRHGIFSGFEACNGHGPSVEASCGGANNWWFQTRMATTDHGVYGVKRFHDWHIDWGVRIGRKCNFLEPQMGWWQPRTDVPRARGHMLDEMEYYAGKNAGHDAAMSLQGVQARPLPVGVRRQLAVLGWYERPRLARTFDPQVQAYLAGDRTEGRLRQDAKGGWQFTELLSSAHRAGHEWEKSWKVDCPEARSAAMRVEALYRADEKTAAPFFSADEFARLKSRAAAGVEVRLATSVPAGEHGRAFALAATNASAEAKAAWAEAKASFDFPGKDLGGDAIAYCAWVKGDGSGALLNLQLTTPGEFVGGISDHHVRLDFTGWKRITFLLRERDAAHYGDCRWPYGGGYAAIYRNFVNPEHVGSFAAYLNDIPRGKGASVEISEVSACGQVAAKLEGAVVTVNGAAVRVPFALAGGEYAELDGGFWTRHSALGERLERVVSKDAVRLGAGANGVTFAAADPAARAEVTFFAFGRTRPAFVQRLTDEMRRTMRYEAVEPFEYAPAKGLTAPAAIAARPGEKAKLSFEIVGPCANPTFGFRKWFGFRKYAIVVPATAGADETIVCANGIDWKVVKSADGTVVKEGRLEKPLPVAKGVAPFAFSATLPEGGTCIVDILKEYL